MHCLTRAAPACAQLCQLHDTASILGPGAALSEWAIRTVAVSKARLSHGVAMHHVTPYFCSDDALLEPTLERSLSSHSPFRCEHMPFIPKCEKMLFTFAPGDRAMAMPKGVALAVTSRYLLLQVHYIVSPAGAQGHPAAAPVTLHPVPTTLELQSTSAQASSAPPLELAHFFELGPRFPSMLRIPAKTPRTKVTSICAPSCLRAALKASPAPGRFVIYAIRHHMHRLGVSMKTEKVRPDGSAATLWESRGWSPFKKLPFHVFEPPIQVAAGDALRATCVYSSAGKGNATTLGTGIHDEMCFSYMLTTAVPEFSSCWHVRAASDVPARSGCYGICKGLGQSVSFRTGAPNLMEASAARFEVAGGTSGVCTAPSASQMRGRGGGASSSSSSQHSVQSRRLEQASALLSSSPRSDSSTFRGKIEFVPHSGWGNMMMEVRNALILGRELNRRVGVPHFADHDVIRGVDCHSTNQINTGYKFKLIEQYANLSAKTPSMDYFLSTQSDPIWAPSRGTLSELENKAQGCCHAVFVPTTGRMEYNRTQLRSCQKKRCTHVVLPCPNDLLQWDRASFLSSLRAVQSETIVFGSIFHRFWAFTGAVHPRVNPAQSECTVTPYRSELYDRVKARLSLASVIQGAVPGSYRSYDAVHLRLGEQFTALKEVPCGPGCMTRWPSALQLLRSLDEANESRPVFIATDLPEDARLMAAYALKRRTFFMKRTEELANPHVWLLDYLGGKERAMASFMAPILVDILVSVLAANFYGNAGFLSTYTTLISRERVCLASAEGREPPSDTQLVEVTSHLKGMRWALRPPHGARAR